MTYIYSYCTHYSLNIKKLLYMMYLQIVVIIRGLPGSGKSVLAKKIKEVETENGGSAPRILSMDDYFLNDVSCFYTSRLL